MLESAETKPIVRSRIPRAAFISAIVLILLPVLVWVVAHALDFRFDCDLCWRLARHHHADDERLPLVSLKTISTAQAYFRANGRNGDGVNKFWRTDIAGLYAVSPAGGPPIRLIELSTAAADDRPRVDMTRFAKPEPRRGYWYRAIRHADEKTLDAEHRFAAECHPADYPKSGRYTFIIDENNTIYGTDLGHGRGLEVFPTDEELRTKWRKVD